MKKFSEIHLLYRRLIVSAAMGAVTNLVLLFIVVFLFSGVHGNEWVKWYLGYQDGLIFMLGTALLAIFFFQFVRNFK